LTSEGSGDDNGISAAAIPVMTQQQDRGHSSLMSSGTLPNFFSTTFGSSYRAERGVFKSGTSHR
jgi:CRISPR/Cas system-associated endonuclease/helicase Cas3